MSKTGQELANYAISKIGTPYFYGCKMQTLTEAFMASMHSSYPSTVTTAYMQKARNKGMIGKTCVDCSGLPGAYRGKQVGSAQLYSTASERISISTSMPVGTIVWKTGHVGVYIGNGYVVEAKGIDYGVVKTQLSATAWKYGLKFSDISYTSSSTSSGTSTSKGTNPYSEPTLLVCSSATAENKKYASGKWTNSGNSARWVQWELVEAGYSIAVDGDFGSKSTEALKKFQQSCKITADGICGATTRKYLKAN